MLLLVLALVAGAEPAKTEEAFLKEIDALTGVAPEADPSDVASGLTLSYNCTAAYPKSWRCNLRAARFGKWMADHGFPDVTLALRFYAQVIALAPAGDPALAEAKTATAELSRRAPKDHPADGPKAPPPLHTPPPPPVAVEREAGYLKSIRELNAGHAYDQAVGLAEQCLDELPASATCHRLAGSLYARIANRDRSMEANEKARIHYEKFLEVAPPDDENVPKVRAVLESVAAAKRAAAADAGVATLKP